MEPILKAEPEYECALDSRASVYEKLVIAEKAICDEDAAIWLEQLEDNVLVAAQV